MTASLHTYTSLISRFSSASSMGTEAEGAGEKARSLTGEATPGVDAEGVPAFFA